MGGRGSKSSFQGRSTTTGTVFRQMVGQAQQMQPQVQAQLPPQQQVQNQPPTQQNTPVQPGALTALTQMDDDQLAQLARSAQNIQMPNHLSDKNDVTQQFIFAAGLNAKPTVMDAAGFKQFMQDNNIPQNEVLVRVVDNVRYSVGNTQYTLTGQQIAQMFTDSRLTYSGGKQGGQALGGGNYFAQTGGGSSGYNTGAGSTSITAVLNPNTARAITKSELTTKAARFAASHPKFARVVGQPGGGFYGNNWSIYALAMGYNVIRDPKGSGSRVNIIDRSAVVVRR